jgi:hypothetical protein
MDTDRGADVREIEAIIARQFNSLNWEPERSADWQAFSSDFAPSALLYPAARPAKPQNVEAFIDRMKGLAGARSRKPCLAFASEFSVMSQWPLQAAR